MIEIVSNYAKAIDTKTFGAEELIEMMRDVDIYTINKAISKGVDLNEVLAKIHLIKEDEQLTEIQKDELVSMIRKITAFEEKVSEDVYTLLPRINTNDFNPETESEKLVDSIGKVLKESGSCFVHVNDAVKVFVRKLPQDKCSDNEHYAYSGTTWLESDYGFKYLGTLECDYLDVVVQKSVNFARLYEHYKDEYDLIPDKNDDFDR